VRRRALPALIAIATLCLLLQPVAPAHAAWTSYPWLTFSAGYENDRLLDPGLDRYAVPGGALAGVTPGIRLGGPLGARARMDVSGQLGYERFADVGGRAALVVALSDAAVGRGLHAQDVLKAIALGAVGPVLRGSGVAVDARSEGFAAYGDLGFDPIVEEAGDSFARTKVRLRECYQSIDLVRRAIAGLPDGDIAVRPRGRPVGRTVSRVEQPRGELFYMIAGDGSSKLDRLRIRTPTFANVPPLVAMLPGCEMADVPVITLSIDPCISCTER